MHASGVADFHKVRTSNCNTVIHCPNGIVPDDDDCYEGELGTSICYFAPWSTYPHSNLSINQPINQSISQPLTHHSHLVAYRRQH